MNRRSFVRWLGLAPVAVASAAATTVHAADAAADLEPNVGAHYVVTDPSGTRGEIQIALDQAYEPMPLIFDGQTLMLPSLVMSHPALG